MGGSGSPVVLDLRGYGARAKPAESDPETCSERTMAGDVVRLAGELGHGRSTLAGHDRGAPVAFRTAPDNPEGRALAVLITSVVDTVGS